MSKLLRLLLGYIQPRLITKSVKVGRDENEREKEKLALLQRGVCPACEQI